MTYFERNHDTTDAEDEMEEEESIFETSIATEDTDIRNLNNYFQLNGHSTCQLSIENVFIQISSSRIIPTAITRS